MSVNIQTLTALRSALQAALEICIKGESDSESIENTNKIVNTLRQVELTILLNNTATYAIAGTQGAGKTTLAKEILGIHDRWLKPNPGRGEQIPLFIEQRRDIAPGEQQGVFVCLNGETGELAPDKRVSESEFTELLQDWTGLVNTKTEEGYRILYPKLLISAHDTFIDEDAHWVLLPGYEIANSRNHRWQEMMRHVLLNARGVIVVTDQTLLANASQNAVQKDLRGNFAERPPVVVISRTESLSAAERDEVRASAAKIFNPSTTDNIINIVTTGVGNRDQWIDALYDAFRGHLLNSAASESAALERTMDLIRNDVGEIINSLKALHNAITSDDDAVEEILSAFDTSVDRYERELRRHLERELTEHKNAAFAACEARYKEEEEGLWNNAKILGRRFMAQGVEIDRIRKQRVLDAWASSYNNVDLHDRYFRVFDISNRKTLAAQGLLPEKPRDSALLAIADSAASKMGYLCDDTQPQHNAPAQSDPGIEQTLRTLLYKPTPSANERRLPALEKTLAVFPALAMELPRATLVLQNLAADAAQLGAEVLPNQIFDALFGRGENYYPIRTALGALIGIDAADGNVDGEYNPDAPDGVAAIALLGKAAVVASVAYGAYQLAGVIRDSDRAQIHAMKRLLEELAFSNTESIVGQYRDVMADMRNLLEHNLKQHFGSKDVLTERSEIILAIKKLAAVQKEARRYETHVQQILA
ncbi:hypothetical protein AAEY27_11300 [Kosakonia sp. BYX6]|uniref:Dynamin family protein n=1 Tax=Kosakonia calanthes TaxID=3139408 RepID=A0ABZ3AZK3_9ENTR